MRSVLLVFLLSIGAVLTPAHADLGKKIAAVGDWEILRSTDAMTDKASCIATPKGRPFIQLDGTSFAVSYRGRGGIEGYKMRLDDNPPSEMRLPSKIEKDISALVFKGDDYQQIIQARRVRIQAVTLVRGLLVDDVDMSASHGVLEVLNGPQCN